MGAAQHGGNNLADRFLVVHYENAVVRHGADLNVSLILGHDFTFRK